MSAADVKHATREANESPVVEYGARVGFAIVGLLHLLIAYLALKIAWGDGGRSADQSGALPPGISRVGCGLSQSPATVLTQTPSGSPQASDWESGDQVGLSKPGAFAVAHSGCGTGTAVPVRTSPRTSYHMMWASLP